MSALPLDVKYALRRLRHKPGQADDPVGREALRRYVLRPPLA